MNRVDTINPGITAEILYQWKLIRDCVAGEKRMKDEDTLYLPKKGGQTDRDYERYKARAKWADYTEQALNTMHGMIFRKAPSIDAPDSEELQACIENFNREGNSLYQFASDSAYDNMQTAFGGFLVDMPQAEDIVTYYDAMEKGIRPFSKYYPAEKVINWKFKDINGTQRLSMVVLKEEVETEVAGEFGHSIQIQYRVLDIDESGFYRVRLFREWIEGQDKVFPEVSDPIYVIIKGKPLEYIPFFFVPYKKPEKPMLYGVAELNKHYYMQSADYENGIHYTTIPTGYSIGHVMERDESSKKPIPIRLGGDSWLNFQETECKVGTLQFAGEGLVHCETALASTQEQIGILGTRAISPDKAMSETADAAKIHRQGESAKLATYARNLSEVFTRILTVMASWLGVDGKVNVAFNVDYDTITFDPNMMNSIANLSREGKFPIPLVYEALNRGELLPTNFTLQQFAVLVDMENAGATPTEIIEVYSKMKAGELVDIIQYEVPMNQINENVDDTPPSETKQISMENGK